MYNREWTVSLSDTCCVVWVWGGMEGTWKGGGVAALRGGTGGGGHEWGGEGRSGHLVFPRPHSFRPPPWTPPLYSSRRGRRWGMVGVNGNVPVGYNLGVQRCIRPREWQGIVPRHYPVSEWECSGSREWGGAWENGWSVALPATGSNLPVFTIFFPSPCNVADTECIQYSSVGFPEHNFPLSYHELLYDTFSFIIISRFHWTKILP